MSLVGLLIFILVVGLVLWLVIYFIDLIPLPAPFGIVAKAIVALIAIIILLGVLFGGVQMPVLRIT